MGARTAPACDTPTIIGAKKPSTPASLLDDSLTVLKQYTRCIALIKPSQHRVWARQSSASFGLTTMDASSHGDHSSREFGQRVLTRRWLKVVALGPSLQTKPSWWRKMLAALAICGFFQFPVS